MELLFTIFLLSESKMTQSFDDLQKRVKELELINFDSELHFDAAKEHINHLQRQLDEIKELNNERSSR